MQSDKKVLFLFQVIVLTPLCLSLASCSATPPLPLIATSLPHPIQTEPISATIIPKAYPPPGSPVTPEPYPVNPAIRSTPRFSPTPEVDWNYSAIEVTWDNYRAVSQPEWLSNTIAKLAVYSAGHSLGYVTVDISEGQDAKAIEASIDSDWKIYSSQKTFVIDCSDAMRMYQASDKRLVSEPTKPIAQSWRSLE
jgi:hypothetical protein